MPLHQRLPVRLAPLLPYFAFFLLVLGGKLLLISRYGSLTPMHDEWDGIGYRLYRLYVQGQLGWGDMFGAFNEHRIVTTRFYELLLLKLNGGVWNPVLQMTLNAVLHAGVLAGLLFGLRQTCPERQRGLLLVFALILLGLPLAVENALVGFQSQFYFLMLFSFTSLWAFATAPALSRRWWLGLACGLLALISMASGALSLLVGAIFLLLRWWRAGGDRRVLFTAALLGVLAGIAIALTPSVHTYDPVRAHSPVDFGIALLKVLSWPVDIGLLHISYLPVLMLAFFLFAVLIHLPLLRFLVLQMRKPPEADDSSWLLFLGGLWVLSQLLAICYSRASIPVTSRYADLFSLGLLLNAICLLRREPPVQAGAPQASFAHVWMLFIVASLLWYGGHRVLPALAQKLVFSPVAEANVRAYLSTHDYSILQNNEYPFIPYAEPGFLKKMLDDPALVSVLPTNLAPANAPRESLLVATLIAHLQGLAVLLLAAGGMVLGLYAALRQPAGAVRD
jgi:hypothetical protein